MNGIESLSQANQVYLNANKQQSKQKNVRHERKFNKKAAAIGAVALGIIVIGGLVAVGKFKKTQQLAEYIDFTPAKTLEEAKKFAREYLHIRKFNLTDLDTANYINEAIVNFNNNISADHKRLIRAVEPRLQNDIEGIMGVNGFRELMVDEEFFKNIDKEIIELAQTVKNSIGKKRYEFPDVNKLAKMTLKDKVELYDKIGNSVSSSININDIFANLFFKNNIRDFLKANPTLPQTVEDFLKLDNDSKKKVVVEIIGKTGIRPENTISGSPFRLFNHEIGHVLHSKNVGSELFDKYSDYETLVDNNLDVIKLRDKFKEQNGESLFHKINATVTPYATTTPAEFVAEVYSFLCNGVKFPDEIMNLYKKYGGPILKNVT